MSQEEKVVTPQPIDMARIAAMRAETVDTRELVRKVATYLFLECGIHPSANKVLELTHKGSMGTITDELSRWWSILRGKLATKVLVPDLPESVNARLGELGAELWQLASNNAKGLYEQDRANLQDLTDAATRVAEDAKNETLEVRLALSDANQQNSELRSKLGQTEEALAEARQSVTMLNSEVARRTEENRETQRQLATAQEKFSKELESQRDVIAKIEQRATDTERKHLLEIDRARQETVRRTQENVQLREAAERAATDFQRQLGVSQQQAADLQQKVTQVTADKSILEANLNSKIGTLESRLASSQELLESARLSLTAAAEREQSLKEQLTAMGNIVAMMQEQQRKQEAAAEHDAKKVKEGTKGAEKDSKA